MNSDPPQSPADFSPFGLLKSLGFYPYALVTIGIFVQSFAKDDERWKDPISWISGILFLTGILLALVKLASGLFAKRPARGLVDGLTAGIVAGFLAGYLGYGSHPAATESMREYIERTQDSPTFLYFYQEPSYIRILFVMAFAIPIAGIVGLGCDLIHTDRKINWRRDLGLVAIVGFVFISLVGYGIFAWVPHMVGTGIKFSEIQLIFEIFLPTYCILMAFNLGWRTPKLISRILLVIIIIFVSRGVTYIIQSDTNGGTPLWNRQYLGEPQQMFELSLHVIYLIIWAITCYFIFYHDSKITKWLDGKLNSN